MTVSLSLLAGAGWQFFDDNGNPLSGGLLYTYEAGTTTPVTTYTSSAGTTANANPVVLDAAGRVPEQVWLNTAYTYKFLLRTSTGVSVWSKDNIPATSAATTISSALVEFVQAGAGAVTRTAQAKMREVVSVEDFGAVADGVTDASTAFQNAVNALPSAGGEILIGPGAWLLNTNPSVGTKSIVWNIDPAATWSGTGVGTAQFLSMATNPNQLAAGTHIRSQSTLATPSSIGGIGAFSVEMIQPSTYSGSSVAIYAGASSASSQPVADVWGINTLVRALSGATGVFQAIEADVDTYASGATTKGIGLNGVGNYNATVAVEIIRADSSKWNRAIYIANSLTGIQIETPGLDTGLLIGGPVVSQTTVSLGQIANFADALLISRKTDTAPNGYYLRFVNAANTSTLFSIDVAGSISSSGNIFTTGNINGNIVTGANFRATDAAIPASAGVLAIGSATSTTATAGAQTLPANPAGFIQAYLGGTLIKIPYYAA